MIIEGILNQATGGRRGNEHVFMSDEVQSWMTKDQLLQVMPQETRILIAHNLKCKTPEKREEHHRDDHHFFSKGDINVRQVFTHGLFCYSLIMVKEFYIASRFSCLKTSEQQFAIDCNKKYTP